MALNSFKKHCSNVLSTALCFNCNKNLLYMIMGKISVFIKTFEKKKSSFIDPVFIWGLAFVYCLFMDFREKLPSEAPGYLLVLNNSSFKKFIKLFIFLKY